MGSSAGAGSYTDAAKRLAGRSVLAIGSGIVAGSRLVAKGVSALTADGSDREQVRFLRFAELEWSCAAGSDGCGAAATACQRIPALLIGLSTGFQVWRLDGANPAELASRRDGPVKLLEALPEPRPSGGSAEEDSLRGARPLLAVVPASEQPPALPAAGASPHASAGQQQQQPPPHILQLYSLCSHGYVRTLSFSSEVAGVQASGRLLVVALRGQLQAFDARTLHHTFSCLTYTPPPPLTAAPGHRNAPHHQQQQQGQQQFLSDRPGSSSSGGTSPEHSGPAVGAASQQPPAVLPPFALGPRWLAYAADTPVPQTAGQAVAQRLPLARSASAGGTSSGRSTSGALDGEGPQRAASSGGGSVGAPGGGGPANGLTTAAVADVALQAAAKGGQQLRAGLTAVGSASFKYLSQQYASWRQGQQPQRDLDALEADAAVAGTVAVRDACSRAVVAHFRAHTSPLAALRFSPGGTLLATASVAGHSINLFRVVPPPGAGAGEGAGGTPGHAVHLYRLYRGVTPAAIRDVVIAPDASWVAASSGRGTTHLFHTPAAAPGARQLQQQAQRRNGAPAAPPAAAANDSGVAGQPPKTLAVGRARKPGLLSGGVAGAATSAARNLYAGQSADAATIAAAFLTAGPGSPRALPGGGGGDGCSGSLSLYVVTSDGLLTRHLLRTPPSQHATSAADASGSLTMASGGGAGAGLEAPAQDGPSAAAAAAVLEEADRWDVARHASWPEREELLPGLLPAEQPAGTTSAPDGGQPAATPELQQLWVAQADSGALAAPAAGAAPLWQDSQFRFYELQMQQLQRRQSAAAELAPQHDPSLADVAGQLATIDFHSSGGAASNGSASSSGAAVWLENIPVRAVQQQ